MPRKVFKCALECSVHTVRSPGTWLPNRDDIYLTVEVFNCTKRTRLTDPIFPLIFHERFCFEKMYWSANDPLDVVEMLEDVKVSLELRQVADIYLGGTLLAYFDGNARDFFYPSACTYPRVINDRELIMLRTIDFPGISPRIEFSTYTVIEECTTPYMSAIEDAYLCTPVRSSPRPYCYDPCVHHTHLISPPNYERPTVSSLLRSVCPSPVGDTCAADHVISDLHRHHFRSRRIRSKSTPRQPLASRKKPCHDSLCHALALSPVRQRRHCSTGCRYPVDSEVACITRHHLSRSSSPVALTRSALNTAHDARRRVAETLRNTGARTCSPNLHHHHHYSPRLHRSCEALSDLETDLMIAKHRSETVNNLQSYWSREVDRLDEDLQRLRSRVATCPY